MLTPEQNFHQRQMEKAFSAVQPKTHWKDRIDATLTDAEASEAGGLDTIREAIIHFTATVPTITRGCGNFRFQADGYWAGPAGDC